MPGNVLCLTFTNKATDNLRLRVRRALATLDLPEGEEPEIMNYHGFAASLLDRYGVLAGFEPGARVLNQAQREELCGRVLDRMTFEFTLATFQPSLVEQDPGARRPAAEPPRHAGRGVDLAREPARRAEGPPLRALLQGGPGADRADRGRRDLPRAEGRARRDRLRRPDRPRAGGRRTGSRTWSRTIARASKPCCSTSIRTRTSRRPQLMAALFGAGHPVTAVGDPDQNIYAWRGASLYNLFRFPQEFPKADGTPAAQLPLYTNFRSGARILAAADAVIGAVPEAQRPPGKRLVPWEANGQGEVRIVRVLDEWTEAQRIADRCVAAARGGLRLVRDGGAVPHVPAVHAAAPGLRRARGARRDRRARRPVAHARGRRGARVRARGAGPDRQRRARPHPPRPALPGRVQGHRAARAARHREDQEPARRLRAGGRRHREPARVAGRGARAPGGRRGVVRARDGSGSPGSARSSARFASRRGGRSASSSAR